MKFLDIEAKRWVDTEECAQKTKDYFDLLVNSDEELSAHRTFIEKHAYGMGERCFHWLWKLIVDEMPDEFRFLEIGVYMGQVLSLIRLLADRTMREADIVGVTLLSPSSGGMEVRPNHPDVDYMARITTLHDKFELQYPSIVVGDSTDPAIQRATSRTGPFDIVYVDGCHEYDYVVKDLLFYPGLLRRRGLLVVDDSSNFLKQPWGFFQGIEDVSRAVRTVIETDPQWEHLLAVVHNRVWRRIG